MERITAAFEWLFNTRPGVATLFAVGIVLSFIVAFLLERRMRRVFVNHEKVEGEGFWSFFDEGDEDESSGALNSAAS